MVPAISGCSLLWRETTDSDGSDIDLLIDLVGKPSSWFPSGMALELQDLLGRHVDILTGEPYTHYCETLSVRPFPCEG
jgi:predicted nucleotidyltransferase